MKVRCSCRYEDVLIIARVTDQRAVLAISRQIVFGRFSYRLQVILKDGAVRSLAAPPWNSWSYMNASSAGPRP